MRCLAPFAAALLLGGCVPDIRHATVAICGICDTVIAGASASATDAADEAAAPPAVAHSPMAGGAAAHPAEAPGAGASGGPSAAETAPDPLAATLRNAEGLRLDPYRGPRGRLHIGYGHLITPSVAELLLGADIAEGRDAARRVIGAAAWDAIDRSRQDVLAEAAIALGEGRLRGFENMIAALQRSDFAAAAAELKDSLWGREQAPSRVARLAALLDAAPAGASSPAPAGEKDR